MSIYFSLFHGRSAPDEHLDDWGTDGPIFGPLDEIQSTYDSGLRLYLDGEEVGTIGWGEDDLIYYAGMYYGDIHIFAASCLTEHQRSRLARFEAAKAIRPKGVPPFFPIQGL